MSEKIAVEKNLKALLPDGTDHAAVSRAARQVFQNFSRYLVDFFYADRLSGEWIEAHVEIHGLETLREALRKGKGAILVSAHLGHWELAGMVLAKLGLPIHVIAVRHRDPAINRYFLEARSRHGVHTILVDTELRQCFRVLQENKILALNGDRLFGKNGVPVRFLGRDVLFPKGFARFSHCAGAPVVTAFFIWKTPTRCSLNIETLPTVPDEREKVQLFADRLSEKLQKHPTQWFIFQPFWETPQWPV